MANILFEELGGKYERQGDYLIPCLTVPAEKEQPFKVFLRLSVNVGKVSVQPAACEKIGVCNPAVLHQIVQMPLSPCAYRLIEGMKQAQDITERLKEENALEWTGRMNNIRACAREIVNEEIIFA